ncbi:hypothetical protein LX90_007733 [Lentzea flava]|nr:hypothetical protein [Lentzea flava]MCP2204004.1 hypothetical protein [Lentzea flava]
MLDLLPVHGRDVTEVGHARKPMREHRRGVRVVLDVPRDGAAEHGLNAQVEPTEP